MPNIKDRISKSEAMRHLNVSRRQIEHMVGIGELQCIKLGSRYFYYPDEVERLRKQREQENHER